MNFSINKDVLLINLLHIQKGLPVKTTFPILNAIRFEVKDNSIVLTSSNSDITIETTINDDSLNVNEVGTIAVPGKYFIEIIRKVNANIVEVALIEDRLLVIKADRSEFKLKLLEVELYPNSNFIKQTNPIVLSSDVIKSIVKETNFACAITEKRPILTGVNFKYSNDHLYAVATDSYRLSQKNIPLKTSTQSFDIVIPSRSLDELSKIVDTINAEIEVYISENTALFKLKGILFQTRLLQGAYPDTLRIIPRDFVASIPFNKEMLLQAVERVSLLSPRSLERNFNIIKLTLNLDQTVEISSTNNEIGDALEELTPSNTIVGGPISIAFSSKNLVDALKALDCTEVIINLAGEIKPFTIIPADHEESLHLILPVRFEQ